MYEMYKLPALHRKILKQVRKNSDGISTERLIKINKKHSGIEFVLSELKDEKYLSQLISQDDKIAQAMELEVKEYTGDWIITNKGLAYLRNNKIEFVINAVNRLLGFVAGIISTFLIEITIYLIFC